ncbi:MAG: tetratricopeptide repeat protein, partial [Sphingomonadales bacterium]|nr:tetratricopeptide repeat protein [Sphingomonadales bacterium]
MTDALQSLADRAARHMSAGRFAEAATDFAAVLAREPDHPDIWYNLGYAQRRARQYEEALAAYRQALDRGVGGPEEVHLNRAVILAHDLGRSDEAMGELAAALKLAPRYFPALLNLGGIHEDRGEREQAREVYARALEAKPGDTLVLTRLAVLSDIEAADHPLIARMRRQIDSPQTSDAERADLGFALGQILDRIGAYDEAFAAYDKAN